MKRNPCLASLRDGYIFNEVQKRKMDYVAKNPNAKLISLGVGDTSQPLPKKVAHSLETYSQSLSTKEGYSGYGVEEGEVDLRKKIASHVYQNDFSYEEIFISDGAKCDMGRLQLLFGSDITVAVQDPAYPTYSEGSLLQGVKKIIYMECLPENNFFPNLEKIDHVDIIYFCSPNNPTGAAATLEELTRLVNFAKQKKAIILYDAAYVGFIQDPNIPKSIYDIPGAKSVAIEVNSFSKSAGFSGVRLGWTVTPKELLYNCGKSVNQDFNRVINAVFNGASKISQKGGLAILEAQEEFRGQIKIYLENALHLKNALLKKNYEVYGGTNAPYLWLRIKGKNSWEAFDTFLDRYHLVTTPGIGFGKGGEGYLRISSLGTKESVLEAVKRLAT
jgi:LL-diaminopimelate aminotransferase